MIFPGSIVCVGTQRPTRSIQDGFFLPLIRCCLRIENNLITLYFFRFERRLQTQANSASLPFGFLLVLADLLRQVDHYLISLSAHGPFFLCLANFNAS